MRRLILILCIIGLFGVFVACSMIPVEDMGIDLDPPPPVQDVGEVQLVEPEDVLGVEDAQLIIEEPVAWLDLVKTYGLAGIEAFIEEMLVLSVDQEVKNTKTHALLFEIINANRVQVLVEFQMETEWGLEDSYSDIIVLRDSDEILYSMTHKVPDVDFEVFVQTNREESFIFLGADLGEGFKVYRIQQDVDDLDSALQELQGLLIENLLWIRAGIDSSMKFLKAENVPFNVGDAELDAFIECFELEGMAEKRLIEYLFIDDVLITIREITEDRRGNPVVKVYTVTVILDSDVNLSGYRDFNNVPDGLQDWVGDLVNIYTAGKFGKSTDLNNWNPERKNIKNESTDKVSDIELDAELDLEDD